MTLHTLAVLVLMVPPAILVAVVVKIVVGLIRAWPSIWAAGADQAADSDERRR